MGLQVEIAERSSVIVVTLTGPTDIEALEPLHDASQVAASEGQTVVLDPVGTFARQLFLGETLDADAIAADYHAEVLTLAIPVREAAKPRKLAGLATDEWCSGQSGRELAPDRGDSRVASSVRMPAAATGGAR